MTATRKLAAILAADVRFSRLMSQDEAETARASRESLKAAKTLGLTIPPHFSRPPTR
jgi:hypothetical protein